MSCELCGSVFAQKHRVLPGAWGGTYTKENNVVLLCPNHHAAVHFLMRWWMKGARERGRHARRLAEYRADGPLWTFWLDRVLPVCEDRKAGLVRLDEAIDREPGDSAAPPERMTCDEAREVYLAAKSWRPPSGYGTWHYVELDRRRMRVDVSLYVCHRCTVVFLLKYRSEAEVHAFLSKNMSELAGFDLVAAN